jgi:hypothetical protein
MFLSWLGSDEHCQSFFKLKPQNVGMELRGNDCICGQELDLLMPLEPGKKMFRLNGRSSFSLSRPVLRGEKLRHFSAAKVQERKKGENSTDRTSPRLMGGAQIRAKLTSRSGGFEGF